MTPDHNVEECNVLIIGGGPAGSSLAWALRDSGLKIVILDRNVFPRNKVCAGWITPSVITNLQIDIEDYVKHSVMQAIHGFRVGILGQGEAEINYSGMPVSYGIRRYEFDDYLLRRCGAKVKQGVGLDRIERISTGWIVNESIHADMIVGAGGHFCPIAQYINQNGKKPDIKVVAQEIEVKFTDDELSQCDIDKTVPELFFCDDLKGYGWVFPKGNYLNIGLGREDASHLSQHVHQFCDFLIKHKKIPENISEKFRGHAYQLYQHSSRRIVSDAMLLIGDAAGLAYTQSGEGISPAIESGLIAARVIKKANGDYSLGRLGVYEKLIQQRFGRRSVTNKYLKIPLRVKKVLANKLMGTKWFVQHIVLNKWFLHKDVMPLNMEQMIS